MNASISDFVASFFARFLRLVWFSWFALMIFARSISSSFISEKSLMITVKSAYTSSMKYEYYFFDWLISYNSSVFDK